MKDVVGGGGGELYFAKAKLRAVSCSKICEWTWYVSIRASCQTQSPGYRNAAIWIKLGQPLFLLVMTPAKLATSPVAYSHIPLAHRFSSKRETACSLCKRLQRFLKSYSHRFYSLCTGPPFPQTPLPLILLRGGGLCTGCIVIVT